MMMSRSLILTAGSAMALSVAGAASAQWVTFENEASTRLQLTEINTNDSEEKDIAVGDFDQDGWTDVVVARKRPFSTAGARVDVLLMNEQGTLVDRTADFAPEFITTPTDARDVVVADMDNDGWLDMIIVSTFGVQPQYYANLGEDGNGNWLGFENQSEARFPTITSSDVVLLQFCAGWAGDLDGDGWKDFYFSNYNPGGAVRDVLFMNTGNGFFVNETEARLGNLRNSAFGTNVEFADLDSDGDLDIIKTSTLFGVSPWNSNGVFSLINDGTGNFTWPGTSVGGNDPYMFRVADYNDDGRPDIYVVKDSQDRMYLRTSADGATPSYQAITMTSPRTTGFGGNVKQVDIDNDGDLDLGVGPIDVDIANCGFSNDFALLRNPGNGILEDPWAGNNDQNFHTNPHDIDFLDIDNDGCMDIFMGLCTGYRVFIQTSEGCGVTGPAADLNGDGFVNGADIATLLSVWGSNGAGTGADLDGNGTVDGADLAQLLAAWTG